jgi:uncharacterized membrane protein
MCVCVSVPIVFLLRVYSMIFPGVGRVRRHESLATPMRSAAPTEVLRQRFSSSENERKK